jgi:hypothetical protein
VVLVVAVDLIRLLFLVGVLELLVRETLVVVLVLQIVLVVVEVLKERVAPIVLQVQHMTLLFFLINPLILRFLQVVVAVVPVLVVQMVLMELEEMVV